MTASRRGRRGAGPPFRIGQGLDIHPLGGGRPLILGGVRIPSRRGLLGHSDADVLTHAICDALLGALGLPDLGERFPASDRRNRRRSSLFFLRDIAAEIRRRGEMLCNVDAVILAEAPKLQGKIGAMRRSLARALDCDPSRIGLRAKRGEGIGAIGRGEGMMAQAVALLAPAGAAPGTAGAPRQGRRRPG